MGRNAGGVPEDIQMRAVIEESQTIICGHNSQEKQNAPKSPDRSRYQSFPCRSVEMEEENKPPAKSAPTVEQSHKNDKELSSMKCVKKKVLKQDKIKKYLRKVNPVTCFAQEDKPRPKDSSMDSDNHASPGSETTDTATSGISLYKASSSLQSSVDGTSTGTTNKAERKPNDDAIKKRKSTSPQDNSNIVPITFSNSNSPESFTQKTSTFSTYSTGELQAQKKVVKNEIKHYVRDFLQDHGRKPTISEKEPIRHLYKIHNQIKYELKIRRQIVTSAESHVCVQESTKLNSVLRPGNCPKQNSTAKEDIPDTIWMDQPGVNGGATACTKKLKPQPILHTRLTLSQQEQIQMNIREERKRELKTYKKHVRARIQQYNKNFEQQHDKEVLKGLHEAYKKISAELNELEESTQCTLVQGKGGVSEILLSQELLNTNSILTLPQENGVAKSSTLKNHTANRIGDSTNDRLLYKDPKATTENSRCIIDEESKKDPSQNRLNRETLYCDGKSKQERHPGTHASNNITSTDPDFVFIPATDNLKGNDHECAVVSSCKSGAKQPKSDFVFIPATNSLATILQELDSSYTGEFSVEGTVQSPSRVARNTSAPEASSLLPTIVKRD